jgi:AbrB family looped-hinge helix DNA binding protein
MVMEVVKIDEQGRLVIPKTIRERRGLEGEIEVLETDEGVLLRPKREGSWEQLLGEKLTVDWSRVLAISLEDVSIDDLIFR